MAIALTYNIPVGSEADVDLVSFDRTNLVFQGTSESVSNGGTTTRESTYIVAAGDKTLPTKVVVRASVRAASTKEPYGAVSYAIRVETVGKLADGTVELFRGPASFTTSWNVPGQTLYDESQIHDALQALASLMWSAVNAGVPQDGNMTKLAYGDTRLFG